MFDESEFDVTLDLKSSKPSILCSKWIEQSLKIVGTTLYFYRNNCLEPVLFMSKSVTVALDPEYAEGRSHAFQLTSKDGRAFMFSACSEELRNKCIVIFNFSSQSRKWYYPGNDKEKCQFFSNIHILKRLSKERDERLAVQRRIDHYETLLCEHDASETGSDCGGGEEDSEGAMESINDQYFGDEITTTTEKSKFAALAAQSEHMAEVTVHRLRQLGQQLPKHKVSLLTKKKRAEEKSAVRNRSHTATCLDPDYGQDAETQEEKELQAQQRALVRLQRLWRSRSTRFRVLNSMTHTDHTPEQIQLLVNMAQSKFRVRQAVRLAEKLRAQQPQIIIVSFEAHDIMLPPKTELSCVIAGVQRTGTQTPGSSTLLTAQTSRYNLIVPADGVVAPRSSRIALVTSTCQLDFLTCTLQLRDCHRTAELLNFPPQSISAAFVRLSELFSTGKTVRDPHKLVLTMHPQLTPLRNALKAPRTCTQSIVQRDLQEVSCVDGSDSRDGRGGDDKEEEIDEVLHSVEHIKSATEPAETSCSPPPVTVHVTKGKPFNAAKSRSVQQFYPGTVSVSVSFVDMTYAMCGWLHKLSDSLMAPAHTFKRRYFVLVNNHLQYFASSSALDLPKYTVQCCDVVSLSSFVNIDGRRGVKIVFLDHHNDRKNRRRNCEPERSDPSAILTTTTSKRPSAGSVVSTSTNGSSNSSGTKAATSATHSLSEWCLLWDEEETTPIINMWVRKLYRACSLLVDPTLTEASCLPSITRCTARGSLPAELAPKTESAKRGKPLKHRLRSSARKL